jgi:hypothetical protein
MSTGPQSNLSAPAGFSASDEVFNDNFPAPRNTGIPTSRAITPRAPFAPPAVPAAAARGTLELSSTITTFPATSRSTTA